MDKCKTSSVGYLAGFDGACKKLRSIDRLTGGDVISIKWLVVDGSEDRSSAAFLHHKGSDQGTGFGTQLKFCPFCGTQISPDDVRPPIETT